MWSTNAQGGVHETSGAGGRGGVGVWQGWAKNTAPQSASTFFFYKMRRLLNSLKQNSGTQIKTKQKTLR
jgi:hypothetical protein